ncbi:hypothetical protein FPSE_11761 [Fusarium pseudograminearum CS3096]|uniref:Uncharacterized protein n=1 Tax=Fusarium pseudograminearum (strain CS3096) TaxID=1028729 RepID=K3VWX5_FUSPC|nr:hypothetical protein FPSE_11761 [Fusarium pseudograminearum CS3096]EKJ67950.1 hypothetical protein FPSE_11761 [Fusarium pseudograminearum CS3096]
MNKLTRLSLQLQYVVDHDQGPSQSTGGFSKKRRSVLVDT